MNLYEKITELTDTGVEVRFWDRELSNGERRGISIVTSRDYPEEIEADFDVSDDHQLIPKYCKGSEERIRRVTEQLRNILIEELEK